jgi:hypothetical protein
MTEEDEERWLRRAEEDKEWWLRRVAGQEEEWLRQNNVVYGGLIAIGIVMVQQFLTAQSLDVSAKICVISFAVAIPLLAALLMVNRQESFRRKATSSRLVIVAKAAAQASAFTGMVAGFWHIFWIAGVVVLASTILAVSVHTSGYVRLERDAGNRGDG